MLMTPWGEALDREHPLPEYPRPQFRRESYLNLNGPWEYAITKENMEPEEYEGEIIVPFAPESELSGVGRTLQPGEYLWYHRSITLPEGFNVGRVILHFGAVDQCARVWVNGEGGLRPRWGKPRLLGGYNGASLRRRRRKQPRRARNRRHGQRVQDARQAEAQARRHLV